MKITDQKFDIIKEKSEIEYKKINSIYCPYLKDEIIFNSKGLEHIKFKGRNKARLRKDQYIRFRCLPLASQIIRKSHTLQGFQERNEMVKIKKGKWEKIMKKVKYFEFITIINNIRTRIIVKEIIGEKPYFLSIIPFWKTNVSGQKIIHNGNPNED